MTNPGWPGVPPQPARRRPWLVPVLVVAGLFVVLCCGGGITGGVFLFKGVMKATGPARDAVDSFVTDLEEGDTAAAYGLLCSDTKGSYTQESFASGVAGQPKITGHKIQGVSVNSTNGRSSATVDADLTEQSGFVDHHTFALVKESDAWKVCGQPY